MGMIREKKSWVECDTCGKEVPDESRACELGWERHAAPGMRTYHYCPDCGGDGTGWQPSTMFEMGAAMFLEQIRGGE
jgi:hypothetical protein